MSSNELPEPVDDRLHLGHLHEFCAKLGNSRLAAQIAAVVLPEFNDPVSLPLVPDRKVEVIKKNGDALVECRFAIIFAGFQVMLYLVENPWVLNRSTGDHDPIATRHVKNRLCLCRRFN